MLVIVALLALALKHASAAPVPDVQDERGLLGNGLLGGLSPNSQGPACLLGGQHGNLLDGVCIVSNLNLKKRDTAVDGTPCKLVNGSPGAYRYGLCTRTVDERGLLDLNHRKKCKGEQGPGYEYEGICIPLLDGALDIDTSHGLLGRDPANLLGEGNLLTAGVDVLTGPLGAGKAPGYKSLLGLRNINNGYYDDDDLLTELEATVGLKGLSGLKVRSDGHGLEKRRFLPIAGEEAATLLALGHGRRPGGHGHTLADVGLLEDLRLIGGADAFRIGI